VVGERGELAAKRHRTASGAAVTSLKSVAVLRPDPRLTAVDEVAPEAGWRGVCEAPGETPADMAVRVGRTALAAADADARDVQWVLHAGVGPQGSQGWPVHHHIQNGIVGNHGNALEVKQNCAAGLTTWLFASRMLDEGHVSVCTGADNWSWTDRFANSRTIGGEPFSDVAHATVVSLGGGFAKILGSGTASHPGQAEDWRGPRNYWEATTADDFRSTYADATAARSVNSLSDSIAMIQRAVKMALSASKLIPQYVTHFVPQGSASGQPFRWLAGNMGLPWSPALQEHSLDHGYLGVSTHAEGLIHLTETGCLGTDSIVLLLACEYQLSATAIVCRIVRPARLQVDGPVRVMS
jgi:3-oxoacyl-[acyl-carrier-protein] synthase III